MNNKSNTPPWLQEALTVQTVAAQYDFLGKNMGRSPRELREAGHSLASGAANYGILTGIYLNQVDETGLCLALGHRSAVEFATKGLGLSETSARRYMTAAKLAILVREEYPDLNQSQALALGGIKADSDAEARKEVLKVLKKATENGTPLTADGITQAIDELNPNTASSAKDPNKEFLYGTLDAKERAEKTLASAKDLKPEQKQALEDYSKAAQRVLETMAS